MDASVARQVSIIVGALSAAARLPGGAARGMMNGWERDDSRQARGGVGVVRFRWRRWGAAVVVAR